MDERPQYETGIYQNPEENTDSNLFDLSHSNFFLEILPKAKEARAKMNYWDFIKIKRFCTAKDSVNKTKDIRQNGRRYLQMTYQIKG